MTLKICFPILCFWKSLEYQDEIGDLRQKTYLTVIYNVEKRRSSGKLTGEKNNYFNLVCEGKCVHTDKMEVTLPLKIIQERVASPREERVRPVTENEDCTNVCHITN